MRAGYALALQARAWQGSGWQVGVDALRASLAEGVCWRPACFCSSWMVMVAAALPAGGPRWEVWESNCSRVQHGP